TRRGAPRGCSRRWTPPERRARPSPDARSDGRSVASTGRARYTDELRIRESFQCAKDGSLAQLVEQRTFNPLVGGSNPPRPTRHRGVGSAASPFFFFARLARRRVAVGRRRTGYPSAFPGPGRSVQSANRSHLPLARKSVVKGKDICPSCCSMIPRDKILSSVR